MASVWFPLWILLPFQFSLSFQKVRPRNICFYWLGSNNQQVVKLSKVQKIAEQTQQDGNTRCNGFVEQLEPVWFPMPFPAFWVWAFHSLAISGIQHELCEIYWGWSFVLNFLAWLHSSFLSKVLCIFCR